MIRTPASHLSCRKRFGGFTLIDHYGTASLMLPLASPIRGGGRRWAFSRVADGRVLLSTAYLIWSRIQEMDHDAKAMPDEVLVVNINSLGCEKR